MAYDFDHLIESGRRSRPRGWVSSDDNDPSHLRQHQQRHGNSVTDNPVLRGWFSLDGDTSHLHQRQPMISHDNSATNHPTPVNTLSLLPTKHLPPSLPSDRTASTTDKPLRICCPHAQPKQLQYSAGRKRIWTQFQGWRTWGDMNERWGGGGSRF